jgi:O-succinylbenzoate synthase
MQVREILVRELRMKMVAPFTTSMDSLEARRILLIEAQVDGVTGYGECTAGESPFYSPEDTETAWHVLRDFLWPMIKGKEFSSASGVYEMFSQVRGHNMAKASLECAIWDADAKMQNMPLWKLLGGTREEIACGVSIGIKDSLEELTAAVKKELASGYQRIKIKIKPGKDIQQVQRLREEFPRIKLMVDANSAYSLKDWPLLKQMDAFYLMMMEQPLGWDDIFGHMRLQRELNTPICLDECVHTLEQAEAAIGLNACKIINIKVGRVGGHAQARLMQDLCEKNSIPVWCGGMLETGIGRAHNIAMSTLPNFSLPGDVSASKRYWQEDIIEPEVTVSAQGTIRVPQGPGIGFEPRRDLIEKLTVRKERLV